MSKPKVRKAYIGVSYPLLYDYKNTRFIQNQRTLGPLPNPIIESPVGLMIMYDEIWFLTRALCPINMRSLPYVHYVDEEIPTFDWKSIIQYVQSIEQQVEIRINRIPVDVGKMIKEPGMDVHSREIIVGDTTLFLTSNKTNFLLDYFIVEALQNVFFYDVELVTNSIYTFPNVTKTASSEFVEQLIVRNVPNYLTKEGPYHECFEELRENEFLKDFRKWVISSHNHIQQSEISEMCDSVEAAINKAQQESYISKLKQNKSGRFWLSTAKTVITSVASVIPNQEVAIAVAGITIADAGISIVDKGKEFLNLKEKRWQGFVIQSKDIVKKI